MAFLSVPPKKRWGEGYHSQSYDFACNRRCFLGTLQGPFSVTAFDASPHGLYIVSDMSSIGANLDDGQSFKVNSFLASLPIKVAESHNTVLSLW